MTTLTADPNLDQAIRDATQLPCGGIWDGTPCPHDAVATHAVISDDCPCPVEYLCPDCRTEFARVLAHCARTGDVIECCCGFDNYPEHVRIWPIGGGG